MLENFAFMSIYIFSFNLMLMPYMGYSRRGGGGEEEERARFRLQEKYQYYEYKSDQLVLVVLGGGFLGEFSLFAPTGEFCPPACGDKVKNCPFCPPPVPLCPSSLVSMRPSSGMDGRDVRNLAA